MTGQCGVCGGHGQVWNSAVWAGEDTCRDCEQLLMAHAESRTTAVIG